MLIKLGKLIFEILASVKAMALTSKVMEARISFNCWKLKSTTFYMFTFREFDFSEIKSILIT